MRQESERLAHRGGRAFEPVLLALALAMDLQGFTKPLAHLPIVERLFQDAHHPALVDGGDHHVFVGIGRSQQPHHMALLALDLLQQGQPVATGHAVVGHQYGDIGAARAQQACRIVGAA